MLIYIMMGLLCLITACKLQNVVLMSFCTDSICEISALSTSDFVSGFDLSSNMCANDSDWSQAQ